LVVVFVPSKNREGEPIDQERWVDEVLQTLGQRFRGATAYPRGHGVWRDDANSGALLAEEPVIVFSYAAEAEMTHAALTDLYHALSRLGRETNQGEIGVVIDGTYYGITDYEGDWPMLRPDEIEKSLHASRVVDLNIAAMHGPLGLEHLASVVASLQVKASAQSKCHSEKMTIALTPETRQKLERLATTRSGTQPGQVSAAELAAAIVEQFVTSTRG
jgi:hypothetical protein